MKIFNLRLAYQYIYHSNKIVYICFVLRSYLDLILLNPWNTSINPSSLKHDTPLTSYKTLLGRITATLWVVQKQILKNIYRTTLSYGPTSIDARITKQVWSMIRKFNNLSKLCFLCVLWGFMVRTHSHGEGAVSRSPLSEFSYSPPAVWVIKRARAHQKQKLYEKTFYSQEYILWRLMTTLCSGGEHGDET